MVTELRRQLDRQHVIDVYNLVLQRSPESEEMIGFQSKQGSIANLALALMQSEEYREKNEDPPKNYDLIGAQAILRAHAKSNRSFSPGYITNFIGVDTDVRYCRSAAPGVEPDLPSPRNFHATMTEWAAALRAVDLAGDTFCVVELGARWGCWMVKQHSLPNDVERRYMQSASKAMEGLSSTCESMPRETVSLVLKWL